MDASSTKPASTVPPSAPAHPLSLSLSQPAAQPNTGNAHSQSTPSSSPPGAAYFTPPNGFPLGSSFPLFGPFVSLSLPPLANQASTAAGQAAGSSLNSTDSSPLAGSNSTSLNLTRANSGLQFPSLFSSSHLPMNPPSSNPSSMPQGNMNQNLSQNTPNPFSSASPFAAQFFNPGSAASPAFPSPLNPSNFTPPSSVGLFAPVSDPEFARAQFYHSVLGFSMPDIDGSFASLMKNTRILFSSLMKGGEEFSAERDLLVALFSASLSPPVTAALLGISPQTVTELNQATNNGVDLLHHIQRKKHAMIAAATALALPSTSSSPTRSPVASIAGGASSTHPHSTILGIKTKRADKICKLTNRTMAEEKQVAYNYFFKPELANKPVLVIYKQYVADMTRLYGDKPLSRAHFYRLAPEEYRRKSKHEKANGANANAEMSEEEDGQSSESADSEDEHQHKKGKFPPQAVQKQLEEMNIKDEEDHSRAAAATSPPMPQLPKIVSLESQPAPVTMGSIEGPAFNGPARFSLSDLLANEAAELRARGENSNPPSLPNDSFNPSYLSFFTSSALSSSGTPTLSSLPAVPYYTVSNATCMALNLSGGASRCMCGFCGITGAQQPRGSVVEPFKPATNPSTTQAPTK